MSSKRKPPKGTLSPASATKKKKISNVTLAGPPSTPLEICDTLDSVPSPAPSVAESESGTTTPVAGPKQYVFKNPSFTHTLKQPQPGKKGKSWKNLKQIVQTERALPWKGDVALYSNIEAPPYFKPAKKYSDLSGLLSSYTDPHTKLRFANSDEYARAGSLPSDIISGLLTLRKANPSV